MIFLRLLSFLLFILGFVLAFFTLYLSSFSVVIVISFSSVRPISVVSVISVIFLSVVPLFSLHVLSWLLVLSSCRFLHNRSSFLLDNNLRNFRYNLNFRLCFCLDHSNFWCRLRLREHLKLWLRLLDLRFLFRWFLLIHNLFLS